MIVLPRVDDMRGADWAPEGGGSGSFLTGSAAPLPLGSFRLPDAPHLVAAAPDDDDPALRADTMRERAGQVFQRQRAIGGFNRALDTLFMNIAEGPDWAGGLRKYDKELGNLRQKHLAALRTPEDRDAFGQHADAFAAMQRIGLKRALIERQQADALAQLDDQLAYYADKAAQAPNDVFRQMAIDAGERTIAELRDAGYLFPESAEKRQQAFLGRIDGADLEAIARANPDEAAGILDNPALFPNVAAATREKLKLQLLPAVHRRGDPSPAIKTMEWREARDGPRHELALRDAAADGEDAAGGDESTGRANIDDIAGALAPLVEKDNGLRELLDAARANPDDPEALVRLATNLTEIGPTLPEANPGKLLEAVGRLIGPLGRLLRRDRPDDQPPQLPVPRQRGEEPGAPPAGGPSPISPPRAKPPTAPPPTGDKEDPGENEEKPPSALALARDAFEDAVARVRTLRDRVRGDKQAQGRESLGSVTPEAAAHINRKIAEAQTKSRSAGKPVDVTGFQHTIDADEIRHIMDNHVGANETDGRNTPLTEKDIDLIPEILASPDRIDVSKAGGRNHPPSIKYEKRFNGTVYVVEEVQAGAGQLAVTTMYKHPRVPGGSGGP